MGVAIVNGKPAASIDAPAFCLELAPGGCWSRTESGLWVGEVVYTPGVCDRILRERNSRNRRPVPMQIAMLSAVLSAGQFRLTGETVIFNSDGVLADGQNRLSAGVKSNVPFRALTVVGVDPEAFHVMGQGSRRSLSQVLGIMKESHAETVATLLYAIPAFFDTGVVGVGGGRGMTMDQLLDGLASWPDVRDSAEFATEFKARPSGSGKASYRKFRSAGTLAVLHWVFSQVDRELAGGLLTRVLKNTAGDHPDWQPAQTLSVTLEANLDATTRLAPGITEVFAIQAWNAIRAGRQVRLYRHPPSAKYPRVDGWEYLGKKGEELPYAAGGERLRPLAAGDREGGATDDAD